MRRPGPRALWAAGVILLVLAIAALGGRDNFVTTLLYVSCTLFVVCCATGVSVGLAAQYGRRRSRGRGGDIPGCVEIGFLIGFFAVSPLALSGAFTLIEVLSRLY